MTAAAGEMETLRPAAEATALNAIADETTDDLRVLEMRE